MNRWAILLLLSCLFGCSINLTERLLQEETSNEVAYTIGGQGKAVIFIHAGGLDKEMWQPQMNLFKEKFKVIAYDLRGHGSTKTVNDNLFEVDDLAALLEKEGIVQANIVGMSFGAIIALDFSLAYPDLVDKLVLASPGLIGFQEGNPQFLEQISSYVAAVQSGEPDSIVQKLKVMNAIGEREGGLAPGIDEYVTGRLQRYVANSAYMRLPKLKETAPLTKLNELAKETLIMYGELDFDYIRQNAIKLNENIVGSELREIKAAAHLLNLEHSNAFDSALENFLR